MEIPLEFAKEPLDDDDEELVGSKEITVPVEEHIYCPICLSESLMDVSSILMSDDPKVKAGLAKIGTHMRRTTHTYSKVRCFVCFTCGYELPNVNLLTEPLNRVYN
jgi:hypothetical protein